MGNKYKLLKSDTTKIADTVLYRIQALKSFGDVKSGDCGGYVESMDNLSQEGNCWIYGFGKVHDLARVSDNAKVKGNAEMHGMSSIYDNALIDGHAKIYDNVQVYGNGEVRGASILTENVQVYENGVVNGNSEISGSIMIYGDSIITDKVMHYAWERCREIN